MGKRLVFVLFLGGCFDFGNATNAGCTNLSSNCEDRTESGRGCDPSLPACSLDACDCLYGVGGWTIVCPMPDLSVPHDLAPPRRDLSQPSDGGDGSD